ncbi:MAG TPA: response regulator transcription factor [Candidatus Hydrogenedentes bacterium]|nr:response regulator transcription factor [Candidatus Hydrogenedentota bacterium]HIJ74829.1 response regulator transcription factor [Candidatus Hydrogenedentota bacterium]
MGRSGPVLAISDSPDFVKAVSALLRRADGPVMAACGRAAAALEVARAQRPRGIVVDVGTGGMSSLEAIYELRREFPRAGIVAVTPLRTGSLGRSALESGADEIVLRADLEPELVPALHRAMASAKLR